MSGALEPIVVVHGGAGDLAEERRALHVERVEHAAAEGLRVLDQGGTALDAAVRAVEVLEDDPLFNAGTGAGLTEDRTMELDACVMEGRGLGAGAVCALPPFKNPIQIARAVLRDGRHVLYAAEGAARFALENGFEAATLESMQTEDAVRRLDLFLAGRASKEWAGGTVGAVACDAAGSMAAATSTGGTVGKRRGRIGDSPIPGAGTYADDEAGACSATGVGEAIMRVTLARAACDLMRAGMPAPEAARAVLDIMSKRVGGHGGVVLVDRQGRAGAAWNTATMSHAIARRGDAVKSGV